MPVFGPQFRGLMDAVGNPECGVVKDDPEAILVDRGYLQNFLESVAATLAVNQVSELPPA